jgi:pimeloyl-ACP methyl ester carboxylesterase
MSKKEVFYLPGLGADERLFSEMQIHCPGTVLSWPQVSSDQSFDSFTDSCIETWNLPADAVVVGFSFGGMVAKSVFRKLESSEALSDAARLIMISSCRTISALDKKFIKRVEILPKVPDAVLRFALVQVGPYFASRGDRLKESTWNKLRDMARSTDLDFFRWATRACVQWPETAKDLEYVPILQIHGAKDSVIPYPKDDPEFIIENAGHLLTYTQAEKIAELISSASF